MIIYLKIGVLVLIQIAFTKAYNVVLTSDSPVVRGGTVHFVVKLYNDDGSLASGKFRYNWEDNSQRRHMASHESQSPIDTWNVTYANNDYYPPGTYQVQVSIDEYILIIYYPITSGRARFKLTETLNGNMKIIQNGKVIDGSYVSDTEEVLFDITLNSSDAEFLNSSATSVLTYWFVDCVYYGITTNYSFSKKYLDVDKEHHIQALIVAGFDPITTPAPSTTIPPTTTTKPPNTTTKAPVTTIAPNITIAPNSTTAKPNIKALPVNVTTTTVKSIVNAKHIQKRSTDENKTTEIMMYVNGKLVPYNGSFPFVCINNNSIAPNINKTYGYFSRRFTVKAPVSNISVSGNYWLHKGDLLNLMVKCHGTPQFYYCKHIYEGIYNVTGNETCEVPTPDSSEVCEFPIVRYLFKPQKYTIAIVVYNDVGKVVSPVTVTVYEVTQQAQLSVIVVPVSFCLVAAVLIVFGVAYYIQNRSRYIVEVADFDFGHQGNDLEYKTFKERLYDSISNAFMRAPTPSSSEPSVWPPGRKYGSLT